MLRELERLKAEEARTAADRRARAAVRFHGFPVTHGWGIRLRTASSASCRALNLLRNWACILDLRSLRRDKHASLPFERRPCDERPRR